MSTMHKKASVHIIGLTDRPVAYKYYTQVVFLNSCDLLLDILVTSIK